MYPQQHMLQVQCDNWNGTCMTSDPCTTHMPTLQVVLITIATFLVMSAVLAACERGGLCDRDRVLVREAVQEALRKQPVREPWPVPWGA